MIEVVASRESRVNRTLGRNKAIGHPFLAGPA